jgi:hypothetical protein
MWAHSLLLRQADGMWCPVLPPLNHCRRLRSLCILQPNHLRGRLRGHCSYYALRLRGCHGASLPVYHVRDRRQCASISNTDAHLVLCRTLLQDSQARGFVRLAPGQFSVAVEQHKKKVCLVLTTNLPNRWDATLERVILAAAEQKAVDWARAINSSAQTTHAKERRPPQTPGAGLGNIVEEAELDSDDDEEEGGGDDGDGTGDDTEQQSRHPAGVCVSGSLGAAAEGSAGTPRMVPGLELEPEPEPQPQPQPSRRSDTNAMSSATTPPSSPSGRGRFRRGALSGTAQPRHR